MSDVSSLSGASNQLSSISKEISDLSRQIRDAEAAEKAEQAKDVFVFEKRTSDVVNDSLQFSRDIGVLIKDNSRLNAITNLQAGDVGDYFRFRVTKPGEIKLESISQLDFLTEDEAAAAEEGTEAEGEGAEDKPVNFRIQLLTRNGSLLADNDGTRDDLKEAFRALNEGTFEVAAGEYVVKVSRATHDRGDEEIQYAVQLTQGDYKNDFDTIDQPYQPGSLPVLPELPAATVELLDGLNQSLSFIGSLPPIGQSSSDKLFGALTDLII